MKDRYAIACGGTGGHLFPGLAVGECLVSGGDEVMLLISRKEVDRLALEGRREFQVERISVFGLPRPWSPKMVRFIWRSWSDLCHCRRLFREFKPRAVLGMGGFTSTAPILAARRAGIRSLIHESNALAGKANRLNARWSDEILLGVEDARASFAGRECVVTGTPVRTELARRDLDRVAARKALKLDPERFTLLVIGGSQGARGLNQAMIKALPLIKNFELQVIHLTGSEDEKLVRDNYRRNELLAKVTGFSHEMPNLYAAADLVVARAGASTLAELCTCGLPAILVPYPYAAEDHQRRNADVWEKAGAARMIDESETAGEELGDVIAELFQAPEKWRAMAASSARLAIPDAAERVAARMKGGG